LFPVTTVKGGQVMKGCVVDRMKFVALCLCVFAGAQALIGAPASAQSFPTKTVRFTTQFSVGSGPDLVLRVVTERLTKRWAQAVIVENRTGASGAIVLDALKRSPPTGYEFAFVEWGPVAALPVVSTAPLPYDAERDFIPVTAVFDAAFFLVASSKLRVDSARELIAAAKAAPGRLSFATNGVASSPHLSTASFNLAAGIDALHVPFKDQGQMVGAIASGDVDYMFLSATSAAPATKTGRAKLLAYGAKARATLQPDVPTLMEAAGIDIETGGFVGIFARQGTPAEIIGKLSADVAAALREKEVADRIVSLGFDPLPTTSEEFASMIALKRATISELVRATGIRLQ
jgi:tripartite-type tricarboxylate transporter receptor subunit TctC